MLALRSILFNLGFIVSIIIFGSIILLLAPLPIAARHRALRWWSSLCGSMLRWFCGLKVDIQGREHLPSTPVIFLANHQSTWETIIFQSILPPLSWVVKRELKWIPLFGWALAVMRPIAIDRSAGKKAMTQVIEQGQDRLQHGISIIIFPEGTRVPNGERRRYGFGGAVLATTTEYPIVPIAHNAGEFWPRHGFIKKPGTIRMVIGPQIVTKGRNVEEVNKEVQEWIESQLEQFNCSS